MLSVASFICTVIQDLIDSSTMGVVNTHLGIFHFNTVLTSMSADNLKKYILLDVIIMKEDNGSEEPLINVWVSSFTLD